MTPSPQSIDRIVLPTDSTIPIARSTEYDTYFRISRSDDPHTWAMSALAVVTTITTDLPRSTLSNDSRLRLLDALAVVVGDASAAATEDRTARPSPDTNNDQPGAPHVDTPPPLDDASRQAIARWKRGHHLFHLFVVSMNSRLSAVLNALSAQQWQDLADHLTALGVLYAGATESMQYASDFPPEIYRDFVRPSMEPPWLEPGFSAVFNRDHEVMLSRVKVLRSALKTAKLPSAAADSARRLWRSQAENRRAHQQICQRFVPGGDSLLQQHFDSTGQTT